MPLCAIRVCAVVIVCFALPPPAAGASVAFRPRPEDISASPPDKQTPTGSFRLSLPTRDTPLTQDRDVSGTRVSKKRDDGDNPFKAFVVGLLLFLSSPLFLFYVERETCEAEFLMNRARTCCIVENMDCSVVKEKYQNCMVHASGPMTAESTGQKDVQVGFTPDPGVEKAVVLHRKVEHLQWVETKHKEDDRTWYTYALRWVSRPVSSSGFDSRFHVNPPPRLPYETESITSVDKVRIKAFELKRNVLLQLPCSKSVDVSAGLYTGGRGLTPSSRYLMLGTGETAGDMRISYSAAAEGTVSVCAVQTENTFRRFLKDRDGSLAAHRSGSEMARFEHVEDEEPEPETSCCLCATFILACVGAVFPHSILLVEEGAVSKNKMFQHLKSSIIMTKVLMRFAGFFMMFFGLLLMLSPFMRFFALICSFIPMIGSSIASIVNFGIAILALVFTAILSSVIIALAWVYFHPECLAGLLFSIGGAYWAYGSGLLASVVQCTDPPGAAGVCARDIVIGQVLVALAIVPAIYYVYLCVQEILFRMTVRRELREREGSFFRGTSVRWNFPHTWGKGGAGEEAEEQEQESLLEAGGDAWEGGL